MLTEKSPALKKNMQPRQAYRYKQREGSQGQFLTQTDFHNSGKSLFPSPHRAGSELRLIQKTPRDEIIILNPLQPYIWK